MINELVFVYYIILIIGSTQLACRFGKEALFGWLGLQLVLANLFVLEQINLFSLTVTSSDAYMVGAFLTLNIIQDRFGKEAANQAIKIAIGLQITFLFLSQAHLLYTPAIQDTSHASYAQILSPMNRIITFSLCILFLTQKLDVWLFGMIKNRFPTYSFESRSCASMLVSQLVDTVLFSLIALDGLISSALHVILFSYAIKAVLILTMNRGVALTRRWANA